MTSLSVSIIMHTIIEWNIPFEEIQSTRMNGKHQMAEWESMAIDTLQII